MNRWQSSPCGPDVSNIPGIPQLDSVSVKGAAGNYRQDIVQNRVQTYERVLNQSQRVAGNCNGALPKAPCLTVHKEPRETACGTLSKATCLKVQGVAGNCNERLKSNYRRPDWTTITCK